MTRVFISYAIGNSDNVVKLSDALLRLEHVEVFVPSCSTYDGTNTSYKIKEALDDSITLIITGIHTNICAKHTAYDVFVRGYDILAPEDAVTSFHQQESHICIRLHEK